MNEEQKRRGFPNGKALAIQAAESPVPAALEAALLEGDVARLSPEQRSTYYRAFCESLGLNWLTRPLDLLKGQDGKFKFYVRKEAADQLARTHQISFRTLNREVVDDLYIVEIRGTMPSGRTLDDQGIVPIGKESGVGKANAMMKATTKARRRVTMGLTGLGWQVMDEDPSAHVYFEPSTGNLLEDKPAPTPEIAQAHIADIFGDDDTEQPRLRLTRPETSVADMAPASHKDTTAQSLRTALVKQITELAGHAEVSVASVWQAISSSNPAGFDLNNLTAEMSEDTMERARNAAAILQAEKIARDESEYSDIEAQQEGHELK